MRIQNIIKPTFFCLVVPAVLFLFAPPSAFAYVTGSCASCHTMHNSQDNTIVAQYYDPLSPGTLIDAPDGMDNLLTSGCVACHSHASTSSYTLGATTVPVVFTTGTPTGGPTAGGNFYFTTPASLKGDNYGHNVRGIAAEDLTLGRAPGAGSVGCSPSCHDSLTFTDANTKPTDGTNIQTNGCQGCHIYPGHHARASGDIPAGLVDGPGDAYRFLSGHDPGLIGIVPNGATDGAGAYEDDDWELSAGANDHNIYKAQGGNPEKWPEISIGRWCAGCHADFHAYGLIEELSTLSNKSPDGAWLRHPTNVYLPPSTASGDDWDWVDGSVNYNWNMPVARTTMNRAQVNSGDQVMCLSCHKAHASEHPNSLRWAYDASDSSAHSGASTTGCFFCHRTKDD